MSNPTVVPPRPVAVRELLEPGAVVVKLETVAGSAGLDREIGHPRIQKPGLALVGHFEGTDRERVQILGQTEVSFLRKMEAGARVQACEAFFDAGFACVIVTSADAMPDGMVHAAERAGCPLLRSAEKSSTTINALHAFLDARLAPRTSIHGVFVDVYGVGILLLGRSGIGKSECGLELVQRGHRLVADDVVQIAWRPPDFLQGTAAPLLKNCLEVRGLGVLDIKDLFGVAAVRDRKRLDLVIELLPSEAEDENWDRLGVDDEWYDCLGVRVPLRRLPVRPGKNTASTVEVAARNELLRQAGHHSAREFLKRLASAHGMTEGARVATPPAIDRETRE